MELGEIGEELGLGAGATRVFLLTSPVVALDPLSSTILLILLASCRIS